MKKEDYKGIIQALGQIIKGTMWEGHVFLVGGCVRDDYMDVDLHDIDLAMDVPNGGIRFVRWLEKRRHVARGRQNVQIFLHYGTAKVRLRRYPNEVIDCVQTRKGRYVFEKNPHPEENFGTIEEDALCRDLTINSLYVNVSTGEMLDPTGMGIHDIENHIIRTPNEPDISLRDNAMHILRCIRFSVRYGWKLDEELLESMKRNVSIIGEATPTRMQKELDAIGGLDDRDSAWKIIEEIGARPYIEEALAGGPLKGKKKQKRIFDITIREVTPGDAEALLGIYAPYVEKTAVSFEYDVPTVEEFRTRIERTLERYPYLVAETEGRIVGYAYAGVFKDRRAYDHCVEISIYIDSDYHKGGIGRRLYEALEQRLIKQGIRNLNACIAWREKPNRYITHQSQEFHSRMGYKKCAHFHKCGYKFGQWFDMIWMEKILGGQK